MVSERLLLGTRLCNAFMFSERLCTSAAQALLHLLPAAAARTEKEPRKRAQQLVGAAAHEEEEEPWSCLIWCLIWTATACNCCSLHQGGGGWMQKDGGLLPHSSSAAVQPSTPFHDRN